MNDPQSKADMDKNFEGQLRKLKEHANDQSTKLKKTGQRKYFRPKGWNGDQFDYETMAEPFSREQANQNLVSAISDQKSPGTTGDVVACTTMINHLAVMERAFRVRQTLRRCRGSAQAIGRQQGHGNDSGPLIQLGVEYVRSVIKQAKQAQ